VRVDDILKHAPIGRNFFDIVINGGEYFQWSISREL
jgi:hypothetical protein